ncbi:MAG: single-stranded DNA-binding protein [Rhodomicrobium sp.]
MKGIECAFTGVLSKDPDLRTSKASGKPFANLNAGVTIGQTDDGKDQMQWVRVVCFGEVAEKVAASAKKGSSVYVEGSLTLSEWNDKSSGEPKHGIPGDYQLGAGHHRLEAQRRLGFNKADLKIGDYDDDQMIKIMIGENATQMGQNAAALIDSIGAVIHRIAYITLTAEWDRSAQLCRTLYGTETGFLSAREQRARNRKFKEETGSTLMMKFPLGDDGFTRKKAAKHEKTR